METKHFKSMPLLALLTIRWDGENFIAKAEDKKGRLYEYIYCDEITWKYQEPKILTCKGDDWCGKFEAEL